MKQKLKTAGRSVRLLPNSAPEISDAAALHNHLGSNPNKQELLYIYADKPYFATLTGVQNLNAYAARDQERPKRDARVGMLPPKLAQILINLAAGDGGGRAPGRNRVSGPDGRETSGRTRGPVILDPFCGTGVVLQEAALMGFTPYGSDLEPRMIEYSRINLEWLGHEARLEVGDATKHRWQPPIDAIASEIYLGQAFSAPPSEEKLADVRHVTEQILRGFLKNLAPQIRSGTPLALAIPAWRRPDGSWLLRRS